jgi:hypothetical protein
MEFFFHVSRTVTTHLHIERVDCRKKSIAFLKRKCELKHFQTNVTSLIEGGNVYEAS